MIIKILSALSLFCFWLMPLTAQPNVSYNKEAVEVSPMDASLLDWFQWIEENYHIQLSYNASELNLQKRCTVETRRKLTIEQLLTVLLKDFKINIRETTSQKLLLQVEPRLEYILEGNVTEELTSEKLAGACLLLTEINTEKTYTAIAENGTFRLTLQEGNYRLRINYLGYKPYEQQQSINQNTFLSISMTPVAYELEETTVRPQTDIMELDRSLPGNKLTYTNANLFSLMNTLPGVIGAPMGIHFQVNGGADDENLLLVDGVPLYHYGHINTLISPFNGDAIKSITFHRNFFPTQFEGRLSSVTEVNMKEGNKQEHIQTLSLDMPAASATFEGPILKNKLSYIIGARRSWLDFFDELVRDEMRMNHSYADYQAKLSYDITPFTSLQTMAYHADDRYYLPIGHNKNQTILKWNNQLFQLGLQTLLGKAFNLTSNIAYTSYSNKAFFGNTEISDKTQSLESGIRSFSITTIFSCHPDYVFHANWGFRATREYYKMAVSEDTMMNRNEPVTQLSLFYDNTIRISSKTNIRIGINFVVYAPDNHKKYHSIQPRISLKYALSNKDLLYIGASRMEQFYHYISLSQFVLPTDFRMPSIEGFRPRSSEHYETGWKHFLKKGYTELSVFYKTRRHAIAFKPTVYPADNQWKQYIMTGNGYSYGVKVYFNNSWEKISLQASYAYIRSKEWFADLQYLGKMPSLYDIPHAFATTLSYRWSKRSSISIGGVVRSDKVQDFDYETGAIQEELFRTFREPTTYRIDAGYSYQQAFSKSLLAFRIGLYSIVGNPPEEEIESFYFIKLQKKCLPYATISFKF